MLLAIRTAVGIQATSALNFSYSCAGSPKTGTSEWLVIAGPLLGAAFAAAAGGFLGGPGGGGAGGSLGFGVGRMEAHPDRQLLFMQDVAGDQQKALQTFAEQGLPLRADHRELLAQRARSGDGRSAQQIKQIHRRGAFDGNQRAGCEIGGKLRGNLAIGGLLRQGAVLEQLFERTESQVAVRHPEQHHLFDSGGAVRNSAGGTRQPFRGDLLPAIDRAAGKLLDKGEQHLFHLPRPTCPEKKDSASTITLGSNCWR